MQTKSKILLLEDNPYWLIPDKLGFELVQNHGVAFSLPLTGNLAVFVSLLIVFGLFYYYWKHCKHNWTSSLGFGMVIGGALGNASDRYFNGAVLDFIKVYWYPVFNIPDILICTGFLVIILFYKKIQKL